MREALTGELVSTSGTWHSKAELASGGCSGSVGVVLDEAEMAVELLALE